MTKAVWSAAAAAATVLFVASPVLAQSVDTKTLNVSATVSARSKSPVFTAAWIMFITSAGELGSFCASSAMNVSTAARFP